MEVRGSGFGNAGGCLSVYAGDESAFPYDPAGDLAPLAERARRSDEGFIDLMNPSSRALLGRTTPLTREHVREYHYGIVTWAPPIKVTARVDLSDGTSLFSHDGPIVTDVMPDGFRTYVTSPAASLLAAPAEEAVVLLPNGGNWFRFQEPLVVSEADIDEGREWVLDLVFNPDGIVKGLRGAHGPMQIREDEGVDGLRRGINVPMLDLVPVPHRVSEPITRETYVANVPLGTDTMDVRVELYSVGATAEGAPTTLYGVDIKSLFASSSRSAVPDIAKVSFVDSANGRLSFLTHTRSPILSGFSRGRAIGDTTTATLSCGTHADRAAAEGGVGIVLERCPSTPIEATFTLTARTVP
jgi:hypothetical protein